MVRVHSTSFEAAVSSSPAELAKHLEATLGSRITAAIAGITEPRAVRQWAAGERSVSSAEVVRRLRTTLHAALEIERARDRDTARSWFEACNPDLGLRTPAQVLRDTSAEEAGPVVLKAALQFAANIPVLDSNLTGGQPDSGSLSGR